MTGTPDVCRFGHALQHELVSSKARGPAPVGFPSAANFATRMRLGMSFQALPLSVRRLPLEAWRWKTLVLAVPYSRAMAPCKAFPAMSCPSVDASRAAVAFGVDVCT
jgi:hypothetical protein